MPRPPLVHSASSWSTRPLYSDDDFQSNFPGHEPLKSGKYARDGWTPAETRDRAVGTGTSAPSIRRLRVPPRPRTFRHTSASQPITTASTSHPSWFDSQALWLFLYFAFNLALTLYNKSVLMHFPHPYTLTALHALCGSAGGHYLRRKGVYVQRRLRGRETAVVAAFSTLYAVNISLSNVSLQLVTVPFHQVVRASTPIFTLALSTPLLGTRPARAQLLTLAPVVLGVALTTYGDYECTPAGFALTLLGTLLAALKTIATSVLQSAPAPSAASASISSLGRHGTVNAYLALHPLDLLTLTSPLAFIQCTLLAFFTGELHAVRHWSARSLTPAAFLALLANGALAFGLNVVSLGANRRAGPLSMTVAANVKQVLAVLLAVAVFDVRVAWVNAAGIALTLVGGAAYGAVEYWEKQAKRRASLEGYGSREGRA